MGPAVLDRGGLLRLPPQERRPALEAYLRQCAARVLGTVAAIVPAGEPLTGRGLDSLSALELKHQLELDLAVDVSLEDLLGGASVDDLAHTILANLAAVAAATEARTADVGEKAPAGADASRPRLSHGQRAMWFLERLAPAAAAYNLAAAARLPCEVDLPALRRAFRLLLERHAVLRTALAVEDGEPRPLVVDNAVLDWRDEDAAAATEVELRERLSAEAHRPFDLARSPLLRLRLYRRGNREPVLLFVVHHVAADFWSLAVMVHELGRLYDAGRAGLPPALPPVAGTWFDHVRLQEEQLAGPRGAALWAYWQQRLANEPPPLELPADRPRPAVRSYRGASLVRRLAPSASGAAEALARGTTPFAVVLAAFAALLHRHTGSEDLLVGCPAAGRGGGRWSAVVGYFVNPVVLRLDLGGEPSFAALRERAAHTLVGALEHQDLPFPLLAERLHPVRDPARPPLFQVLLVVHRSLQPGDDGLEGFALGLPDSEIMTGGLRLRSLALEERAAPFDLTLTLARPGGRLAAALRYDVDRFDRSSVERLLGHLEILLAAAATDPGRPVAQLPLLSQAERHQLLWEWHSAPGGPPHAAGLYELVLAQARRTPRAVALVHGSVRRTYAELCADAAALAARLRGIGVGPEVAVGIAIERSPSMVVALLGTLAAGGAYVPLDVAAPSQRLSWILAETAAPVVLTQERLLARLPPFAGHTVCVDREIAAETAAEIAPDLPATTPGSLAYVIYTSGSTGRPKGVAIEHRAAVALVGWALQAFRPGELEGVLAATSIAFDLSVFEIFVPLASGGKVILAANVLELPWLPAAAEVTLINTVPSAMAELMRLGHLPVALATVNLAGEALPRELADALCRHSRVRRVLNLYGPSETTTYSTWAAIGCEDRRAPAIGRPIAGTRAQVLDRALQPVPAGVAGELFLGGDGVARGYLGQPALTAERFVPDPFAARPGERLYRTGDLARRRGDGTLEFLGRIDHQVKLRGFRIEPGEIEAALQEQPGVERAMVMVREDLPGVRRLVAYLVMAPGAGPPPRWREALRARLPDYMIPVALVPLPALPLTPNGKVDRAALPAPPAAGGERSEGPALPLQGPVEEGLAAIWEAVLGVERVGAGDDFFVLGGHSLLAARVVSRIAAAFGVELPLRVVFEAPALRGLAARIEQALQPSAGEAPPPSSPPSSQALPPAIPRAPRNVPLPLSFAQQRLWFVEQLADRRPLYLLPLALRVCGELAVRPLAAALGEVVRRHEVLRTVFAVERGEPVQRILAASAFPLCRIDLSRLPQERRQAVTAALVAAAAARPFDLDLGPPLRGALLILGAREHVLQLTLHHVAGDGWSTRVLAGELASLYAAFTAGRPSPLPELPIQYADFALWQRRWLTGERLEALLAWWKSRLAGFPPLLELPLDRPRRVPRSMRGRQLPVNLAAAPASALAALGRQRRARPGDAGPRGVTLFMVLLAAFAALLSRLSGAQRIVVGAPIAGRRRPETEGLIGCFVNTLALPIDLTGAPSFLDLLDRVRETTLGAYAHQDLPFEALVEALQPERSLAHAPLVQVVLALQNEPFTAFELAGVRLEPLTADSGVAKFDLTLSLTEPAPATAQGPALLPLAGTLEHDCDLFDAATAGRLWRHFATLLAGAAADPERSFAALPLLAPAERQQLREWNATALAAAPQASLHTCVARQAALAPDAVAVVWDGPGGTAKVLTYGQLDARANRLARDLRRRGVGPGARVGLCLERSPEMVVGLLAILKAGAAYLPLDPSYPPARLRWMIEDARPAVMLTRRPLLQSLSLDLAGHGVEALCPEPETAETGETAESTAAETGPDDLAYVTYTSGSTGAPKGVAIPHRAVVRLVKQASYADFGPDRVCLQLAPLAFDASTFEIWGALANGGRLALFPDHLPNAHSLGAALERHGVTTLWLTAGLFHQVIEDLHGAPGGWRGLRELLAGGDVLSPSHVRRALSLLPGTRLVNGYGPTENTTFTCCHRLSAALAPAAADGAPDAPVPIGRPIAGTFVEVWDRHGERVPVGVAGELMAGGEGLASGYLGRPELTAERFVPAPGGRLYRTGDLVRWLADGTLELLGRLDRQVKVRGFRVEPGEIEAALLEQPGLAAAAVIMREDSPGERRLVAYLVPAIPDLQHDAVRAALRARLPAYMVPAALVSLAALPLTPAGKVDRRALPAPSTTSPPGEAVPQGPVAELVAGIWSQLLQRQAVGADEDFFALGGHSLLAMRVMARLRDALGVELAVRELFEAPTVRALARRIEARLAATADGAELPPLPPLRPASRQGPLPLSSGQERLWFLDQLEPGSTALHIAMALRLRGRLAPRHLAAALAELVRRHESLRTIFSAAGGEPHQVILPPPPPFLPQIDLAALAPPGGLAESSRLGEAAARRPFDLARGPLLRPCLLRLGPAEHVLRLDHHHIVSDGWSLGVLIRELTALYAAFVAGRPSPLPELPVQYADFAVWQRAGLAGERLDRQLAYWRRTLAGEPPALDLPTDRPRPALQTFRGGERRALLAPDLAARLHALGRDEGATLFMILLAAIATLLGRWSGQQDVLIGAPIAGRRLVETEGLIGFFLNTLVLRTELAGGPSFRQLLARAREATLGAFAHQEVPFEAVLADVQPARDLSRTPLFQVFLNLLNLPPAEVRLADLAIEPLTPRELPAKFDLTFYVADTAAGLACDLVYNADLFDAARIQELLDQLALLLELAAAQPDAPVAALPLATARARAVLPDPTAALDASWRGAVHDLFAARAAAAPERLAIADREGGWTYGELDAASDRLARWLAGRGIGRGETVAIWAHRSAPLALAVLGALRTGAAFTILDPAYPAARLAAILRLAAPRAWLGLAAAGAPPPAVESCLAAAGGARLELPAGGREAVLACLADLSAPAAPVRAAVGPDDPAVLGFTSGSTGVPKGIVGRHGSLSHFLPWQCRRFELDAGDRFSLLSGLAHDPLQRDLFTPLYLGAAIVVPDPEDVAVAGRLAAWMARAGITVAHLTPAMAQLLTEPPAAGENTTVPSLRRVLLVGDALTRRDVARIRALAPGATCVNLYGSTETQRAVAYHLAAAAPTTAGASAANAAGDLQVLPLGRGMPDVQLLVINPSGLLAGVGELGEIAVRSPHLALGYLGDPALTAEKFQANPFTGVAADRIYRTGDLARYLPDGEVAFAGRADQQVKIRGFRIEPAEIEAALGAVAGVREAVVLARPWRGELRLAAYIVPEHPGAVALGSLREAVRERLPAYMLPAAFVQLERLPLTPNGKVDRRALALLEPTEAAAGRELAAPQNLRERQIAALWRELLGVEAVGVDDNFFDRGGHSLLLVRLHSQLQELLGCEVPLVDLFRHPTVGAQAAHLGRPPETAPAAVLAHRPAAAPDASGAASGDRRIAVVGMAGRFPGAVDLEAFWQNLRAGVESISRFSAAELAAAGVDPALAADPRFVAALGAIEGEDLFDAELFEVPPRQAEMMDPQFRLLLECAWEALDDAGCDPRRCPGRIGVYAGASPSSYFLNNLATRPELLAAVGAYQVALGTGTDYLTAQISYRLGLDGPSVNVQTACSTALVAVHLACQSLLAGDCDLALAGASSIKVPQRSGHLHEEGGIESPRGRCRSFDAGADGTVHGSGAGIVVLKRLADAVAGGDTIRAVVLGSAINNDGAHKVGLTAPSLTAQQRVVGAALARAGISPDSVSYVEAHGTGTSLGDPIEIDALTGAFRTGTGRSGFCPIGSVKTNIGHLGAAAGIAGLIKTVLALERREIPASLHFAVPNPRIDFAASPFYVNSQLAPWPAGAGPRRAGVSSFGLAGTNVHLILEEAPPAPGPAATAAPARGWQLLPLSAASAPALDAVAQRLAAWLARHPEAPLADVAWTLQTGRRQLACRRAVVCRDGAEARRTLGCELPRRRLASQLPPAALPVVFLFPGQGAQHLDMGRGLYAAEPLFRREIDAAAERLQRPLGRDLRELLYPPAEQREAAARALQETRFAQPALLAVELALARLWLAWGVAPRAMLGHSVGEYAAACLAGVLSREDALDLVAARGELIQSLPAGAMLAVDLAEAELAPRLGPGLALAAVNAPDQCVAAGPEEAIAGLEARLAAQAVGCRRLAATRAFHSAMLDPILGAFAERVARVTLHAPAVPYLSSLTGDWIDAAQATDPAYWVRHLRATVRFGDAAGRLVAGACEGGGLLLLEIGPGRTLGELVRRQAPAGPAGRGHGSTEVVAAMRRPRSTEDDLEVLLRAAGRLWLAGVDLDWIALHGGGAAERRRLPLPGYPFQRRRYWIEPAGGSAPGLFAAATARAATAPAASAPAIVAAPPGSPVQAPRDATESRIAALFETLLGVGAVGADDDFFELGGQSLLGTRLLSQLRHELGVEITLEALFAAPTPAALARRIAAPAAAAAAPPLVPQPRPAPLPLSFAQRRLWVLEELWPGTPLYNVPLALELHGPLSETALRRAMAEIVRRHEALRTGFALAGDEPAQLVRPAGRFELAVIDLRSLPAEPDGARWREAFRRARQEAARPFDLTRDQLLRGTLVRLTGDRCLALCTVHHIAADGWSLGVMVRELGTLYGAFAAGRPSPLGELAVQYADYALWQRGWLRGAALDGLLDFWRGRLAAAAPVLELPADRPRPAVPDHAGAVAAASCGHDLVRPLHALARERRATPFMVLVTAFQALLRRYTAQDDQVLGFPVAGRTQLATEPLIGLFVNTLVLRTSLAGDPSFGEALARVRDAMLAAHAHQELPFELLVEALRPRRDLAHAPLFQVLALMAEELLPVRRLGDDVTLTPHPLASGTAKFDLSCQWSETAGEVAATVEYSRELFDRATVARLLAHLGELLRGAVAIPGRRLSELPLLTPAEAQQLAEWNATAAELPAESRIDRWIAAQAARRPDAIAVVCGAAALSYRALCLRVGRLAGALQSLGVGPEIAVGLCLERGIDLVVAPLAVLAAGGAYLPLDPAHPHERLHHVLRDSAAPLLLGRGALLGGLAGFAPGPEAGAGGPRLVLLDDLAPAATPPRTALDAAAAGALPAYVLYTSGSTGRPKGVVVSHRSLLNFLLAMSRDPGLTPADSFLAVTTLAFDIAGLELWLPLLAGARLEIAQQDDLRDGESLAGLLGRSAATAMQATPASWRLLLDAGWLPPHGFKALCGGEALQRELAGRLLGLGIAMWNLYGPTETTIWASAAHVAGDGEGAVVELGRPLANTRLTVRDPELNRLPIGVPGELWIGGVQLARGYRGRPELTAERFLPDPEAAEPGARLYRTGDLARLRRDGTVDYLGRIDHQVKLRGFRIELGEIEAALLAHPAVAEAVALLRHDPPAEPRLVAYVVPRAPWHAANAANDANGANGADGADGESAAAARERLPRELRRHLALSLPEYMVPAAFALLASLPHTPNGKVDRRALPRPERRHAARSAAVAPRNATERRLAQIWRELLGLEAVSVDDNFFELGGDSILAMRAAARARQSGLALTAREIFQHQTLAELAATIPAQAAAIAPPGEPPAEPLLSEGELAQVFHLLERGTAARATR